MANSRDTSFPPRIGDHANFEPVMRNRKTMAVDTYQIGASTRSLTTGTYNFNRDVASKDSTQDDNGQEFIVCDASGGNITLRITTLAEQRNMNGRKVTLFIEPTHNSVIVDVTGGGAISAELWAIGQTDAKSSATIATGVNGAVVIVLQFVDSKCFMLNAETDVATFVTLA